MSFASNSLAFIYSRPAHLPKLLVPRFPPSLRRVRQPTARPYSTTFDYKGVQNARSAFSFGKLILMTVPLITFGLGTWQVQRLRWKTDLIAQLEERMSKAAIPLPKRIRYRFNSRLLM
ncbi:hypothetical protein BC936DRAFT_147340 [Jimgerdemannia flammicorona]|uniref:SURF1-like protein n=1 Tax=Jimgerdemannia flammicorona TaxID=994334 RepID=A0A433D5L4_9FUNG|nr:hypothetical protein BC936DRAFT_147340 [Jimgerdemannia flammicorona]